MTSMRSVKDIRSDVANARFMSESMGRGTSVPRTNALQPLDSNTMGNASFLGTTQPSNGEPLRRMATNLVGVPPASAQNEQDQKKQLFQARQEIERLKQEYNSLKRNYESISHYAAMDNAGIYGVKKQKEALEAQLKELKVEKLTLEETLHQTTDDLNTSKLQLKETNTKLTNAETEIAKLKKDLERQIKMYEHKLECLTATNKYQQENIQKLKEEQFEFKQTIQKLQDQIAELEHQLEQSRDSIAVIKRLEDQVGDRDKMVAKLERDIAGLLEESNLKDQRYHLLQVEGQNLQKQVDKVVREAERMQQNEVMYKSQIADLQTELQNKNTRIKELEDALNELQLNGAESNTQLKQILDEKRRLEKMLEDLGNQLEDAKSDFKSQLAGKDQELLELKQRLNKAALEASKAMEQKNKAQKELDELTKEVNTLRGKDEKMTADLERIKAEAAELQAKVEQLTQKNSVLTKDCKEAFDKLDKQMELTLVTERRADKSEKDLKQEKQTNLQISNQLQQLKTAFEQFARAMKAMEQPLSCLSCVEFFTEQPHTLKCGHSICDKCFTKHSDPKSPDSVVFCEDCKIETKNKELKKSTFVKTLSTRFQDLRTVLKAIN